MKVRRHTRRICAKLGEGKGNYIFLFGTTYDDEATKPLTHVDPENSPLLNLACMEYIFILTGVIHTETSEDEHALMNNIIYKDYL